MMRLKRYLIATDQQFNYFYFGHKDPEVEKLLKRRQFEEISISGYSENFREEFFGSYIDLIGRLGVELNSNYWWASFTASKNRFMSGLLKNLSTYYTICNYIKENPSSNILVISPPHPTLLALMGYCRNNSIVTKSMNYSITNYFIPIKEKIEHILRIFYFLLKYWSRIFYLRTIYKKNVHKNLKKDDYYVLRTWVYPSSINNEYKFSDPFFGRLIDFLTAKGKKIVILAGIINNYKDTVKKLSKCKGNYLIIPQEFFLNYFDVVKVVFKTFFNRIKLKEKVIFYGLDISEIIQEELDKDYRKSIRTELLQSYIIKNMLKHFEINTFTTTYENNPWEKICFLSLKKYSPSTKIIGYQHAVVTRASANMFISEKETPIIPMPDKIITAGEVTKDMMEKNGHYPEGRIKPSCALRHEYIYAIGKKSFEKGHRILVALEGVYDCYKLVDFVFNGLSGNHDYDVVIRTHPERPFNKIKKNLCFDINLHENFSVSRNKSLKDDLNLADILIYWGSTVSLEALMLGIPVIHVNLGDIMPVDPLLECRYLKWSVRDTLEFKEAISEISSFSDDEHTYQYNKAREYIETYLQEVTDDRLTEFIA